MRTPENAQLLALLAQLAVLADAVGRMRTEQDRAVQAAAARQAAGQIRAEHHWRLYPAVLGLAAAALALGGPSRDRDRSGRMNGGRRSGVLQQALVYGSRADAEAQRKDVAQVLAPMGLRLSEAKTRVSYIDEGLDFLGFRVQRRLKRGTRQRVVYTYPSKKALAGIIARFAR